MHQLFLSIINTISDTFKVLFNFFDLEVLIILQLYRFSFHGRDKLRYVHSRIWIKQLCKDFHVEAIKTVVEEMVELRLECKISRISGSLNCFIYYLFDLFLSGKFLDLLFDIIDSIWIRVVPERGIRITFHLALYLLRNLNLIL